tara:strand:- start:239 stop:412 length:174 start_codon:yes stop_codon:yes gene_type:complete
MLSPIRLNTIRLDTGRPLVIIDLVDGEDNKIFLTETDMEILIKYFEFALDYLEMSKP